MFQVVPQVKVEKVPNSDIIVSFLSFNEFIVLGDDVDGCRMGADRAESCNEEEKKSPGSPKVVNAIIGESNEEVIQGFIASQTGVLHEDGSKRIEHLDDRVEDILVPLELC